MDLSIEGGPSLAPNGHFDTEGFEKIEAIIPKGSAATTVNVQPSALTQLQAIMIMAQRYMDLTFTVDAEMDIKMLDGALLLIGSGNIGMLGATVNDLIFTNANVIEDNMVTILIARTAIETGT